MKMKTEGTNPEGSPGKHIEKAGMYHFVVNDFHDLSNDQNPKISFDCEVIGGEHADQIGKICKKDLFLPEGSQYPESNANAMFFMACSLGIYSKKQWDADLAAGRDADIPFEDTTGMQFIGNVVLEPDKNDKLKSWARIKRTYAVGDDDVIQVSKSADHIAVFGGKLPKSDGSFRDLNAESSKQPAKGKAAATTAAKASTNGGANKAAGAATTAASTTAKDLPPATEDDLFK